MKILAVALLTLLLLTTVAMLHQIIPYPPISGQLEDIPNPETNGDVTVQFAIHPYGSISNQFVMDPSTFQMYFSKLNLSQNDLSNNRIMEGSLTSKNEISFNFAFRLLQQQYDNVSITTLQKTAEGYFSIYKVQEFPRVNERYTYGSGSLHIDDQWWWDVQAIFMETINQQPPLYGIYLKGYAEGT